MTAPGQGLAPPLANPNINPPADQHSRLGWTHLHPNPNSASFLGRYWDLHKAGSVVGTLAASAAATLISAGTGHHSVEQVTDIDWSTSTTTHTSYGHTVYGEQQTIETPVITQQSIPGKPKTQTYNASAANMPDVTSFNLSTTPEARVIIKESEFGDFLDSIASSVRDGYHVSSLTIDGVASDETRLDSKAGLGEHDPKNLGLAKQYQDFVKVATVRGLQKRGVHVEPSVEHGHPSEDVLDGDTLASVEYDRRAGHFKSNLDLINAWKENPDSLDDETRNLLDEALADVRGANISIKLETPAGTIIHHTYETDNKRCVTTNTTYLTTATKHGHKGHNIPLTIIPIPIVRGRRGRRRRQAAVPALSSTGASAGNTPTATPAPAPARPNTATTPVVNPIGDPTGQPTAGPRRGYRQPSTSPNRPTYIRPSRAEIERARQTRERRRRIGGWATIGALAGGFAFVVSGLEFDAGYCPNVEDHAKQSFRWNDAPEYIGVRLHIWGTDWTSGQGSLVGTDYNEVDCPPKGANPNTPTYVPTPEPTCDIKTVTIINGDTKHQKVTETRYPGAVTPGVPRRIK